MMVEIAFALGFILGMGASMLVLGIVFWWSLEKEG